MAKYNRKNRAIVSGIGVGIASIYAIASHFDVGFGELNRFMLTTVVFFLGIVLLAALTVLVFKGLSRLLRGRDDDHNEDRSEDSHGSRSADASDDKPRD